MMTHRFFGKRHNGPPLVYIKFYEIEKKLHVDLDSWPMDKFYILMYVNIYIKLCFFTKAVVIKLRISVKRYNGPPVVKNKFKEMEEKWLQYLLASRKNTMGNNLIFCTE